MPIEIKELHIKITVDDDQSNGKGGSTSTKEKQQLIEQCVEQVMEIMERKKER